jgi:phage shock protein C
MTTQLRRSKTNKLVGGVAGGIAEAYNWDPTLVRLGFVVLALAHGAGVLLYLILLMVMPRADAVVATEMVEATTGEQGASIAPALDRNRTLGYVAIGLGGLMLASIVHLTAPVLALAAIGGGWYLLKHR